MVSAIAIPTDMAIPWPKGPDVASIPRINPYSGWPAQFDPICLKFLMSSRETSA
jgi:hypothetical protein